MKDLLSFSQSELKNLKIGLLLLLAVLVFSNFEPAYEGILRLPIWQPKGRPAERSSNFKAPNGYQGELNDLGTTRFVSFDVLVLIFKKMGGYEMSQDAAAEIQEGVALAREFFWRNSLLQLNINPTFLEVEDAVPSDLLDEEGKIWPKSGKLEKELLARGVKRNQYDSLFLFYSGSQEASGSGMKLEKLGKTTYSFASYPAPAADSYPEGPSATWIFTSQLWYSINSVVYNQKPTEFLSFGSLANELRRYSIQDPPKPYGKIYLTVDYDRDGVPDDEPMVPFHEGSLGLNRETKDSDNDGLEDKRELTAGIFRGTDLFLVDTDGDGLKDGEDRYPLDPEQ